MGTPGFEPFTGPDGKLRCGRKSRTKKPAKHELVQFLVEQGIALEIARQRCFKFPVPGRDCCNLHGGETPVIHGLYSKYANEALSKKIVEARANPKLRDLNEQLAILSGSLAHALEELNDAKACSHCGQTADRSLDTAEKISRIAERFSRIVERYERITEGIKVKILTQARDDLVARFIQSLKDEGVEGEVLRRIAARLR